MQWIKIEFLISTPEECLKLLNLKMTSSRDINDVIDNVLKIIPMNIQNQHPEMVKTLNDLKNGKKDPSHPEILAPETLRYFTGQKWYVLCQTVYINCREYEKENWCKKLMKCINPQKS